ncbi:MAG: DJ-1/PfpI family protein [Lachnospiraceae bacterium]|nr:DJ-1/PfpI family protein [Lachnospiraceae bacterium]MDD7176758.1 DJ-1/PfpI family protein [bacterium]MDY5516017.1 DJ-1 family glyoxalase III [Lachnospiraceae bacterium]
MSDKRVGMLVANGYEEIEMLTVVDLLRRAGMVCDIISVTGERKVISSHRVTVEADLQFEEVDFNSYDALVIPGGMPGTINLGEHEGVCEQLKKAHADGKLIAAICAAPTVFGKLGLLEDKKAICYPGMEDQLTGAVVTCEPAVRDGNIITSRGMGTAIDFGLAILAYYEGEEAAASLAETIVYER